MGLGIKIYASKGVYLVNQRFINSKYSSVHGCYKGRLVAFSN